MDQKPSKSEELKRRWSDLAARKAKADEEKFKRDLSDSSWREVKKSFMPKTLRGEEFFGPDYPERLRQKQREKTGLERAMMKLEFEKSASFGDKPKKK